MAQPPAAPRPAVQPVTAKALADAHREYLVESPTLLISPKSSSRSLAVVEQSEQAMLAYPLEHCPLVDRVLY